MLAIASRRMPAATFVEGDGLELPFPRRQLRPCLLWPLLRPPRRGATRCLPPRGASRRARAGGRRRVGRALGRHGGVVGAPAPRRIALGGLQALLLPRRARRRARRRRGPPRGTLVRRRALATLRRYRSIAALQRDNARCRRCLEAGFPIDPRPVFAGTQTHRAYLYGLAPGRVEAESGLPWQGRAGRTLRRWLRLDEEEFFRRFYCASVTRCYPGPSPSGRGDRAATAARAVAVRRVARERASAAASPRSSSRSGWRRRRALLGIRRLTEAIGKSFVLGEAVAIPLPHPSGASSWLNDETNRARLGKALTHVRRELDAHRDLDPSNRIAP